MSKLYYLAQINIGRTLGAIDSEIMAGFVAQLDTINALAEETPGFVWRLKTEAGNATDIKAFEDELMILNMSVWESLETLQRFTYRSAHTQVMRERKRWFEPMKNYMALWWIPAGHIPTIEEGKERLEKLEKFGATAQAFTFKENFPPPA